MTLTEHPSAQYHPSAERQAHRDSRKPDSPHPLPCLLPRTAHCEAAGCSASARGQRSGDPAQTASRRREACRATHSPPEGGPLLQADAHLIVAAVTLLWLGGLSSPPPRAPSPQSQGYLCQQHRWCASQILLPATNRRGLSQCRRLLFRPSGASASRLRPCCCRGDGDAGLRLP